MKVDVTCRVCGQHARVDVGTPAPGQTHAEHQHVLRERLAHRPSFECFGGHLELRPPLPECWEIAWETLAEN